MTLARFRELLGEQITAGFRDVRQIPLVSRGPIVEAAMSAYEEALEEAKGKPVDSPEMRTLQMVSKLAIGDWSEGATRMPNIGWFVRDYKEGRDF